MARRRSKPERVARQIVSTARKFNRNLIPGKRGQFVSAAESKRQRGIDSYLRAQLGSPPKGKTWFSIASKYPDRFADYLADMDEAA